MLPPTTVIASPTSIVISDAVGLVSARLVAPTCWANCDGSTDAPILNVHDFQCFQNAAAAAISTAAAGAVSVPDLIRADCNGDRVVNVQDFGCFLNTFTAGCPGYDATRAVHIWPDPFNGTTVMADGPFVLRFEATRLITLRLDGGDSAWLETREVCVTLDRPGDWRDSMLPSPLLIDNRTPQAPGFEHSARSSTGH